MQTIRNSFVYLHADNQSRAQLCIVIVMRVQFLGSQCSHIKCTVKSTWETETPEPITTKFCMQGTLHDLTTHATFGGNWLRGLAWRGSNFGLSIDLLRRHYSTLALPCECVVEN